MASENTKISGCRSIPHIPTGADRVDSGGLYGARSDAKSATSAFGCRLLRSRNLPNGVRQLKG